jgi:hypothetical protein
VTRPMHRNHARPGEERHNGEQAFRRNVAPARGSSPACLSARRSRTFGRTSAAEEARSAFSADREPRARRRPRDEIGNRAGAWSVPSARTAKGSKASDGRPAFGRKPRVAERLGPPLVTRLSTPPVLCRTWKYPPSRQSNEGRVNGGATERSVSTVLAWTLSPTRVPPAEGRYGNEGVRRSSAAGRSPSLRFSR